MTDETPRRHPDFAYNVRTDFLPLIVRRDPRGLIDYLNENLSTSHDVAIFVAALAYTSATFQRATLGFFEPLSPTAEGVGQWEISEHLPDDVAAAVGATVATRAAVMIHLLTLNQDPSAGVAIVGAISPGQAEALAVIDASSAIVADAHYRMHLALRRPGLSDTYCGCGLPGFLE